MLAGDEFPVQALGIDRQSAAKGSVKVKVLEDFQLSKFQRNTWARISIPQSYDCVSCKVSGPRADPFCHNGGTLSRATDWVSFDSSSAPESENHER